MRTMIGAVAMVALAGMSLSGCEAMQRDLNSFAEGLMPPTPSEAAEMMNDPHDPDRRRRGTVLIANAPFGGAEPYVKMYRLRVETEEDPTVLAASIRALGRHGSPDDAVLIAQRLEHENEHVRWAAAEALQRIHNPQVVGAMLDVLRDVNERDDVRTQIARGLGQYPQSRVYQALVAALDDRSLALNLAARKSLHTHTGQDFGYMMNQWLAWYEQTTESGRDPFANRQPYTYPTYQREQTLFEKLAFWSENHFEHPAPPIGLRPKDSRSTYEDDGGASPSSADQQSEAPDDDGESDV